MSKLIIPTFNWTGHKRSWIWSSKNPDRPKWQWTECEEYRDDAEDVSHPCLMAIINDCEACSYATQEYARIELRKNIFTIEDIFNNFNTRICRYCPFGAQEKPCFNLFREWEREYGNLELRSELALKIAQLPIRADMRVKVE